MERHSSLLLAILGYLLPFDGAAAVGFVEGRTFLPHNIQIFLPV